MLSSSISWMPVAYTVQVTDVMGRQVMQQIVNVGGDNQSQSIKVPAASAGGVYLVKVTDHEQQISIQYKSCCTIKLCF